MSDSKSPDAAVVTKDGAVAGAMNMKGGVLLSPLPLNGGRRRKSRRASKKIAKALKKLGGEELEQVAGEVEEMATPTEGARRRSRKGGRRHTKRHTRRSRRSLY